MVYCIQATIECETAHGSASIGIPTFYLDDRVQGIVSTRHAEQIARDIICPFGEVAVHVTAYPNYRLEQVS